LTGDDYNQSGLVQKELIPRKEHKSHGPNFSGLQCEYGPILGKDTTDRIKLTKKNFISASRIAPPKSITASVIVSLKQN
jgi:hypothetical protein